MRTECVWFKDGKCRRFARARKCKPSDGKWFSYAKRLLPLRTNQICEYQNPLLTDLLFVTEQEIEDLKNGLVLYRKLGSETIFIALKEDNDG